MIDDLSSKLLLYSVGRELATFTRIMVTKYFFQRAMVTKMMAAWSALWGWGVGVITEFNNFFITKFVFRYISASNQFHHFTQLPYFHFPKVGDCLIGVTLYIF